MRNAKKRGGGEDLVMAIALLLFAAAATAQPTTNPGYNYGPPALIELAQPDNQPQPALGLFANEKQASTVLCIGGGVLMAVGSIFDGMAAKKATLYGTRDGNTGPYHSTRFVGRTLQLTGAASYAIGWSLRKDRNHKHKWLRGIGEAALLFAAGSAVSQLSYHAHSPKPY
jgi:hypothetical protein